MVHAMPTWRLRKGWVKTRVEGGWGGGWETEIEVEKKEHKGEEKKKESG